jgi:hypothetical protein
VVERYRSSSNEPGERVGVAAYPRDLVAELEQPVKHLSRLRACGDVSGQHDAIGVQDRGLR